MDFTNEELILMKSVFFSSSSDSEEEEIKIKRKKRFWVRPYYMDRDGSGAHKNVIETLTILGKIN